MKLRDFLRLVYLQDIPVTIIPLEDWSAIRIEAVRDGVKRHFDIPCEVLDKGYGDFYVVNITDARIQNRLERILGERGCAQLDEHSHGGALEIVETPLEPPQSPPPPSDAASKAPRSSRG